MRPTTLPATKAGRCCVHRRITLRCASGPAILWPILRASSGDPRLGQLFAHEWVHRAQRNARASPRLLCTLAKHGSSHR